MSGKVPFFYGLPITLKTFTFRLLFSQKDFFDRLLGQVFKDFRTVHEKAIIQRPWRHLHLIGIDLALLAYKDEQGDRHQEQRAKKKAYLV